MANIKMPDFIEDYTPDEIAECMPVSNETYRRLWELLDSIPEGKRVPIGGDGSDGTIEHPPEPGSYMSGKIGAIWEQLTDVERADIIEAFRKDADVYRRPRNG